MTPRFMTNAKEKSGILPVYFTTLPDKNELTESQAPKQIKINPNQFIASGHVINDCK